MHAFFGFAQAKDFVIPDSLRGMGYEELFDRYLLNETDISRKTIYAKALLNKGIHEKNELQIAKGYHLLALVTNDERFKFDYLDQAILHSQNLQDTEYPIAVYLTKAVLNDQKLDFKEALRYYLEALNIAIQDNNLFYKYIILYDIGLEKMNIQEYGAAQSLFIECDQYYKGIELDPYNVDYYMWNLIGLVEVNTVLEQYEQAQNYLNEAHLTYQKYDLQDLKPYLDLCQGILLNKTKDFAASNTYLKRSLSLFEDYKDAQSQCISYYYMGVNHLRSKQDEKGIGYLVQFDSLFTLKPYLLHEERRAYDLLLDYFKSQNNVNQQLLYIQKAIKVDSFLYEHDKNLRQELNLKYDTPMLLAEKEKIIKQLHSKNHITKLYIYFFVGFLLFLSVWSYVKISKNRQFKIKYEELKQQLNTSKTEIAPPVFKQEKGISLEVFEVIKSRLELFEREKKYRQTELTLNSLSKEFNTNSTYLSKYMNEILNISFSNYLIELRINDSIETLRNEPKLWNYTIAALAEYFGFNNAETFSKSFYAKTGIYPSFYIREIKKSN
jgi:AraC-like DNA-binding protein